MTSDLAVLSAARPDVALYPPGATFGPRALADLEFVWLLSGSADWSVGTERYSLRPGVLALARPGSADTYRWDARSSSTHAYVHFTLAPSENLEKSDTWPRVRELTATDPMASLCRYLLRLAAAESSLAGDTALIADVLTLLVRLFLTDPLPTVPERVPDAHLLRLTRYLRAAWAGGVLRPVGVGELGAATGLSARQLSRVFQDRFDVAPARAIELLRLGRAAGLLERSNLSIGAVATACGFSDAFHFSKRFRASYHVPPRAYRSAAPHDDLWAPVGSVNLLRLARSVVVEDP